MTSSCLPRSNLPLHPEICRCGTASREGSPACFLSLPRYNQKPRSNGETNMKKFLLPGVFSLTLLIVATSASAQSVTRTPEQIALLKFYPAASGIAFPAGTTPTGVVFDGSSIWVLNARGRSVTKLRASDGVVLDTFPTPDNAVVLVFDGANIWIPN